MFKRKFLYINMLLMVCMFFLVMLFKQSVQEEDLAIQQTASEIVLKEKTKAKMALGKGVNDWRPLLNVEKNSIEKYSTVSSKNLFRPDRKEWKPPPPPPPKPPEKKEEKEEEEEAPKPELPDLPSPFLYGIVIAGKDKRMAIMRGYKQPDVKPLFAATPRFMGRVSISGVRRKIPRPVRKVRPILDKKSSVYGIGDYISGAKIVSIEKDLVTLERDNGTSIEVKLFDKEVKKPSAPASRAKRGIPPRRPSGIRNWSSRGHNTVNEQIKRARNMLRGSNMGIKRGGMGLGGRVQGNSQSDRPHVSGN